MPLIVLLVLGIAVFFIYRGREIFVLSVREGQHLLIRGRAPTRLQQELKDVLDRAGVTHATIKAVRSEGHARLSARGVSDGVMQQMRNVFGTHSVQKLQAAPLPSGRNLGQLLGITWLAWMMMGSSQR